MQGAGLEGVTAAPHLHPSVVLPVSIQASGPRDVELPADTPHSAFLYLAMAGDWIDFAVHRILPKRMVPALPLKVAAMLAQMLFQIMEFHTGASWN